MSPPEENDMAAEIHGPEDVISMAGETFFAPVRGRMLIRVAHLHSAGLPFYDLPISLVDPDARFPNTPVWIWRKYGSGDVLRVTRRLEPDESDGQLNSPDDRP